MDSSLNKLSSTLSSPHSPSSPLNSISLSNLRALQENEYQASLFKQGLSLPSSSSSISSKFDNLPLTPFRISFDTIKSTISGAILTEVLLLPSLLSIKL